MSTQPQSTVELQSPECVPTDYLGCLEQEEHSVLGRIIACMCGNEFQVRRKDQKNCTKLCANKVAHGVRDAKRRDNKELHMIGKNIAFRHFNRDRYLSFDGKYEGPLNKCDTTVEVLKKDTGYRAMPIDVHVKPIEPKFNNVTPDDVDWATKQKSFPHSLAMPRVANNFCTRCSEAIVDGGKKEVRVTRGVYLPIEHDCPKVRVYDLQGKLMEVL